MGSDAQIHEGWSLLDRARKNKELSFGIHSWLLAKALDKWMQSKSGYICLYCC